MIVEGTIIWEFNITSAKPFGITGVVLCNTDRLSATVGPATDPSVMIVLTRSHHCN